MPISRHQSSTGRRGLGSVVATVIMAVALAACAGGTAGTTDADTASDSTSVTATAPTRGGAPTITELVDSGRVLNIAHAGGDVAHPHSTLYGYAESVAAGADVLEMDVQLSADGVVVVIHDLTVDGTTNGTGEVATFTVAELQSLDAAWQFTGQCGACGDGPADAAYPWRGMATGDVAPPPGYEPSDFRIPTLAEVATTFPDMPLDIEIKGTPETGALATAAALANELDELDRIDTAVVVSFSTPVVTAFHKLAPDVAVSPGLDELVDWYFNDGQLAPHYRIIQIPPQYSGVQVLDAGAIAAAAAAGVVVWVWPSDRTQENEATYRQWIDLGVNGIIAGDPAAMAAAVTATGASTTDGNAAAGGASQSGGQ